MSEPTPQDIPANSEVELDFCCVEVQDGGMQFVGNRIAVPLDGDYSVRIQAEARMFVALGFPGSVGALIGVVYNADGSIDRRLELPVLLDPLQALPLSIGMTFLYVQLACPLLLGQQVGATMTNSTPDIFTCENRSIEVIYNGINPGGPFECSGGGV